jgi:chromosome segregation ATPase
MKRAILAVLNAFGLASAGHVSQLTAEASDAAGRIRQLEERLAQVRVDVDTWKRRQEEAVEAAAGWKKAAAAADADTERARADAERLKSELQRAVADARREQANAADWKSRSEKMTGECDDLRGRLEKARTRLAEAERSATTAHEHLMAMEVKLDLIEAALHVLDLRSREHAVSRVPAGDAPVAADV